MRGWLAIFLFVGGCSMLGYPVNRTDARFKACGGDAFEVVAAFPLIASDYQTHFPQMGHSPELEVDEEAFAVVFAEGYQPAIFGRIREAQRQPGPHFVCVYLGTPPTGTHNLYAEVDLTGMSP